MWKTTAKIISEPVYHRVGFMEFYKVNLENKDGVFGCSFGKKLFQDYSQEKKLFLLKCKKGHWGFVCKELEFLENDEELTSWEEIATKEKTKKSEKQKSQTANLLSDSDIFDLLTNNLNLVPQQKGWERFFFCPFHADSKAGKLTLDLNTKFFTCSSITNCQYQKIGDIFDFWAKYKNISLHQVREEITGFGYLEKDQETEISAKEKNETKATEKAKLVDSEEKQTLNEKKAELNPEQEKVVKLVLAGKNVCFLGEAGTGKSFLLNYLIDLLKEKHGNDLFITSYTGRTAINIHGQTLHSFAGIGTVRETDWQQIFTKISKKKKIIGRWKSCKVLIIDEISMLNGTLFDKLEIIARQIKNNNKPFGGIQLIICGDFYQLSPIERDYKWCFEVTSWETCFPNIVCLNQIYRQKDNEFINLLKDVRNNYLSSESLELLKNLQREPQWPDDGIKSTQLYSTNEEANQINLRELIKLPTSSIIYYAQDEEKQPSSLKTLTKNCLAPEKLELKIGAQVMLTVNQFERKLVNGSQGTIINFKEEEEKKYPVVKFSNGKTAVIKFFEHKLLEYRNNQEITLASRRQIPLILCWAITIHKSQGQTIERLKIDCERIWAEGQFYVALSRATNIQYLQIINFHERKIRTCQRVKKYYEKLKSISL